MEIGAIMVIVDSGAILELVDQQEDGARIFKRLPDDTKYDKDAAFYCFNSMLKPNTLENSSG